MKIAIVDDSKLDREILVSAIEKYFFKKNLSPNIELFDGGENFVNNYEKNRYDVIFLDIFMYEKNGMDVANFIRNMADKTQLVFSTSSQDYAIASYDVGALYYILKPVRQEKIDIIFDKLLQKPIEKTIEVLSDRISLEIPISKILWVETFRNLLIIHLKDQQIKTYMTMQKFLNDSDNAPRFLLSCKGVVVNMDYIIDVQDSDFVLKNGEKVQIRKRAGAQVKMEYLRYKCQKTE